MHRTNSLTNNLYRNLRFSLYLIGVMWRDTSESYVKVISDFLIMLARFGLVVWLYYYLFEFKGGTISGETFQTVAWSMFFYSAFLNIYPRYICRGIQEDIRTGNIDVLFSKPANYILYRFSYYLGSRINIFLINTFLGVVILSYFLGIPDIIFTWFFWITFLTTSVLCFVLSYFMYVFIGLLAFWLEDVAPIQWLVDKTVMIFGGAYLPVAFFTPIMKSIAIWSPVGASQFITHTVYTSWATEYLKLMTIQVGWIMFFVILVYFVYKRALKHASVNGG